MSESSPAISSVTYSNFNEQAATVQPLRTCVEQALTRYFNHLGDTEPTNLYEMVIAEVEVPLLKVALQQLRGNQTKVAQMLGLSRGTLRKKLKQYHLE